MNKHNIEKLKIAPYTLKRYESKLNAYFFYNAKNDKIWKTDDVTGSVVATLDGTLDCESIVSELYKNSSEVPISELREHFGETFEFLLKEGYICENI